MRIKFFFLSMANSVFFLVPFGIFAQSEMHLGAYEKKTLSLSESTENSLELQKLELDEGAELELPPFKSIFIEKLITKTGAKIRLAHSSSGANGAPSTAGGDGGSARFFVQNIDGPVLLESRGGDGGNGRNGRPGLQGAPGKKGRDGRSLFGFYVSDGETGFPGEQGGRGESGSSGGVGGHGGTLVLYYREKSPLSSIVLDVEGGDGGNAGLGGLGGLGGVGGEGGKSWKRAPEGPMGARGFPGDPGRAGDPGHPGRASLYQLPLASFRCLARLDIRERTEILTDADYAACLLSGDENPTTLPLILSSSNLVSSDRDLGATLNANGSKGRSAPSSLSADLAPLAGGRGADGGEITILIQSLPDFLNISARGGDGGEGGDGGVGNRGTLDFPDGESGGRGASGGDGGRGGRIRLVFVGRAQLSFSEFFQHLNLDLNGGSGGLGGKGGEGGRADHGLPGEKGKDGSRGNEGGLGALEVSYAPTYMDWVIQDFKNDSAVFRGKSPP